VVVEKPFAKLLAWVGWTYSHSQKRHVFGFHIVLLFWCTGDLRIPVSFRLWRPKREGLASYRTKLELAQACWRTFCAVGCGLSTWRSTAGTTLAGSRSGWIGKGSSG